MFWERKEEKSWDNPCDDVVRRLAGSGAYVGEDHLYTYLRYGDKIFKLSRGTSILFGESIKTVPLSHCAMTPCDGFTLKDAKDAQWEDVWCRKEVSPDVVKEYERLMDGLRERAWTKMLDEARGWD